MPPKPISSQDVEWTPWSVGSRFGERYRHLTLAAVGEGYRVGVAIEELEPGRQSTPLRQLGRRAVPLPDDRRAQPRHVCVYPDSNKLAMQALADEPHVFDKSAVKTYWDGETGG